MRMMELKLMNELISLILEGDLLIAALRRLKLLFSLFKFVYAFVNCRESERTRGGMKKRINWWYN